VHGSNSSPNEIWILTDLNIIKEYNFAVLNFGDNQSNLALDKAYPG
jgi:hypothetical protein